MKRIEIITLLLGLIVGYFIGAFTHTIRINTDWEGKLSARVIKQAKAKGKQTFTESITIRIVDGKVEDIKLAE